MSTKQPGSPKKVKLDDVTIDMIDNLSDIQLVHMMMEVRKEMREHTKLGVEYSSEEEWSQQIHEMSKSAAYDYKVCSCCIGELFVHDASNHEVTTEEKGKLVKLYISIRTGLAFGVDCAQAEYFDRQEGR